MGDQGLFEFIRLGHVVVQRDVSEDALAFDVMGESDDRRFRDIRMRSESRFDFRGAQPVTGNVDDVIDTAGDFVIAVGIALRAVAGEIRAGKLNEVILDEPAVFVIPQTAGHAGPGVFNTQSAFAGPFDFFSFFIKQNRDDAEERHHGFGRFDIDRAGQRKDHVSAGFGLPPGVGNRAMAGADLIVVPPPGFGVERLADGTQNAQRGNIVRIDPLVAFFGDGADGCRSGIEIVDIVFLDDGPEPAEIRIIGNAFEKDAGVTVAQRAVNNVAVTGDPSDVGGAPVSVFFPHVKSELLGHGGIQQVAGLGVDDALGLPGRTGGVKDEQRIFRVHFFGLAVTVRFGHQFFVPDISAFLHVNGCSGAFHNHHGFHAGTLSHGLVAGVFLGNGFGAAVGAVAGNNDFRAGIVDAVS